jgi:RNA polymerase sigma-70 factor (ECF subfamily)
MADSPSEQELARRARGGDREALGELLERRQRRLYNVCLRMLGHREDAAEACQQAMLKAIQNLASFRGDAQFGTWLTRIAINQCYSQLRRLKHRKTASLDHTAAGSGAADGTSDRAALRDRLEQHREPSPEQGVQVSERNAVLEAALAKLDEDHRGVLVLRDIEAMDYRQIAEVLDVKLGTVKSRLFRARLALRQQLEADGRVSSATHEVHTVTTVREDTR